MLSQNGIWRLERVVKSDSLAKTNKWRRFLKRFAYSPRRQRDLSAIVSIIIIILQIIVITMVTINNFARVFFR